MSARIPLLFLLLVPAAVYPFPWPDRQADERAAQKRTADAEVERRAREADQAAREVSRAGATIAGFGLVTVIVVGLISLFFQLIPVGIAVLRRHPNALAITALSILLGWTCFGWVIALVWSLTAIPGDQVHRHYYRRRD